MERINYSQIIQDILSKHSTNDTANGTEIQLLFDTQRHHYQVLNIGWKQQIRTYGVIIHVDIKDDKIWIQRDGTEIGIGMGILPVLILLAGFSACTTRNFGIFFYLEVSKLNTQQLRNVKIRYQA
jgi:hypothetical protein